MIHLYYSLVKNYNIVKNIFFITYLFDAFQICLTSLCDTLRLLGCFSQNTELEDSEDIFSISREENTFHNLFSGNVMEPV